MRKDRDRLPDGRLESTSDAILKNIADGVIGADADGNIIYLNEAAEELTGWTKKDALQKKTVEVFRLVHARDGQEMPDFFRQVILTGVKTGLKDQAMLISRTGEKRYLSANISPVRDESGTVSGAVGVFRDVTRFKTIEEELRIEKDNIRKSEIELKESEEKFKRLFNNVTDAIFLMVLRDVCPNCEKDRIIEVNETATKLLGYGREEFLEINPRDLLPDNIMSGSFFLDAVKSNEEAATDLKLVSKDGGSVEAEVCAHAMVLQGSTMVMVIVRNVTEQKKAQKEVQKAIEATKAAYRAKSEFLANMSHEIRTPLNGIIGMIDLCLLSTLTPEQKDNLITAKSSAASLLSIINNILDFSKLEAGKMTIEHTPFDLRQLAQKLGKVHFYRAADKDLYFRTAVDDSIPGFLFGDSNRLEQVINNLASNAIKFTESGGVTMTLTLARRSGNRAYVRFEIADTGIGIAAEDMNKLFKSFTQVDGSHTRKYGGTGLGLVISRQLIESMGGTLDVMSRSGKGSTFFFEIGFDIAKPADFPLSAAGRIEELKKAGCRAHVLLAEDDKVNQVVVSQMLKMLGYSCEIAENGLQALDSLSRKTFGLCLMDIQMPEMDGMQAVKEIRKGEAKTGAHLPVVALTAYALPGDKERFMDAGMDDYLSKPLGINELGNKIEQVLKNFGAKRYDDGEVLSKQEELIAKRVTFAKSGAAFIKNLGIAVEHKDLAAAEKYAHDIQCGAQEAGEEYIKMDALRIVLIARKGGVAELPGAYRKLAEQWGAFMEKQT